MNGNRAWGALALSRREFLGRATSSVAAGALASGCLAARGAEQASLRWKMRLSASSIAFTALGIEKACARIASLGFEAIDVWSAHAGCPHLDDVLNRLGAGGLMELLAKHKLKLYSFSVYAGGYRRYAELLGKCGGGVAIRGSAGPCDPKELTSRMKAFIEQLKPDVELAEKYNSYLAIENHGHALLDSVDSFKAFVDLNKNPRLGIALAPYHIQALKASVEEAIQAAGPALLYFYAWQLAPGVGQLPGLGPTDFTPWLRALAKVHYRWYVNPFLHGEPPPDETSKALAKSVAYLKVCYEKGVGRGQ
jgi:sugar phosphate isomerase/epimerase